MRTFFQELVDKVIDELAEPDDYQINYIAPYSLISRAWVARTQKHLFKLVYFDGPEKLRKWCRKITPDPAGVSRYTYELDFANINTLEGSEVHIRAFTCVKRLDITECNFLLSPSVVEYFVPMGSSLIRLAISESETTSRTITSLLAGLPQLGTFTTVEFKVTDDTGGTNLISRIPFFESSFSMILHCHEDQQDPPGPPDWIPPFARFTNLDIDIVYFLHKAALVNQWLSGSCTTLVSLAIRGDVDGKR